MLPITFKVLSMKLNKLKSVKNIIKVQQRDAVLRVMPDLVHGEVKSIVKSKQKNIRMFIHNMTISILRKGYWPYEK